MLAHLAVYGCQQNQADGDRLRGMLLELGYTMTDDCAQADLVVLVTCAVRKHAETRLLGHLGTYLYGGKPGRKVVLCGCMAQREDVRELLRTRYKQVALSFGPADLRRFPEYLNRVMTEGGRHIIASPDTAPIDEDLPVSRIITPELNRANVTIMTGCDNYCAYCVVPYVRGRERSRAPEAVLAEVRGLAEDGVEEIWLLGQNVNSYKPDFPDLLRACAAFDGARPAGYTIRFMTSHPRDAGRRLFDAMASSPRISPNLHLPVQSGSTAVLNAMNRGYTREDYIEKIRLARETVPGLVLTSDVIVGFPGETEQDFEDTLTLLEEVRFAKLFTFQYSPREGTPAAALPGALPPDTMKKRFTRLLKTQKRIEEESGAHG
ncbi:MAG: MiaB/RimO family radical SAM methylthiotransferase [Oscillospiraceae bacterium]|nr:MiaB/RimO family radical SAM methylthiotransferase [Oscillospiraceae bacterium]